MTSYVYVTSNFYLKNTCSVHDGISVKQHMATVQRRTPSRLFHQNEYRLFPTDFPPPVWSNDDDTTDFVVLFKKRSRNRQQDFTFIRQKAVLIKKAAITAHLEFANSFNEPLDQCYEPEKTNINFFYHLPKEICFEILSYTSITDIINIAKTCRLCRLLAYDNLLWRRLCEVTWCRSGYMFADISPHKQAITAWYNWNAASNLNSNEVLGLFQANLWRLIYVAMCSYEVVPSIHHSYRTLFSRRTAECYPTKRVVRYTSSLGNYTLKGINNACFVEYIACSSIIKPWHRKEFATTLPMPIYSLREYGLKLARTPRGQHNGEFFRRRGYYLKTDLNRKVHITYRYFPTIRFRLYKYKVDRVLLLCQDVFVSSGETVDCYTIYELQRNTEVLSSAHIQAEVSTSAATAEYGQGAEIEDGDDTNLDISDEIDNDDDENGSDENNEETPFNSRNTL